MESCQLKYKSSVISYLRLGTGSRRAFCFHGYGEDASSFTFLEKYAGDHYSFFAIDIPFHGNTDWKEGYNFSKTDFLQIVNSILKENDQEPATNNYPLSVSVSVEGWLWHCTGKCRRKLNE